MAESTPRRVSFGRWIERSPRPVYALDRHRVVVYANAACLEWLGASAEQVIGQRCDYHSLNAEGSTLSVVVGLCPPPEVLQESRGTFRVQRSSVADSEANEALASCWQMGGENESAWTLVFLEMGDEGTDRPIETTTFRRTHYQQLHLRLMQAHRDWGERLRLDDLVGSSPDAQRVRRQIELAAAAHDANVIISGPQGSGRERVARTIHRLRAGASAHPTLVPLDCRLLDAELLQGIVLGFMRHSSELIETGPLTLLLLEVDQLQQAAQRVLVDILAEEPFAITTLSTCSGPLQDSDALSAQLSGRLSTFTIEVPALSRRLEDLPLLAQAAVENFNACGRRQVSGFSPEALDALWAFPWKRNVDELWEIVQAAHDQCSTSIITRDDLPEIVRLTADAEDYPMQRRESIDLEKHLLAVERSLILDALAKAKGNRAQAARRLGISRAKFLRRLEVVEGLSADPEAADDDAT